MWVHVSLVDEKSAGHMTVQNRLFIPSSEDLAHSTAEYCLYLEGVAEIPWLSKSRVSSDYFVAPLQFNYLGTFLQEAKTKGLRIGLHFSPASIWSQKKSTCTCTWMWEFSSAWPTSVNLVIATWMVKWVGQEWHKRHEMLLHDLIEVKVKSKFSLLFLFLRPKYQIHCKVLAKLYTYCNLGWIKRCWFKCFFFYNSQPSNTPLKHCGLCEHSVV